jgi:hypothetical protein
MYSTRQSSRKCEYVLVCLLENERISLKTRMEALNSDCFWIRPALIYVGIQIHDQDRCSSTDEKSPLDEVKDRSLSHDIRIR